MMKEHCHCHIDEKLSGHSVPFVKPCVRIKEGEDYMVPITPNQLLMNNTNLAMSVDDSEPSIYMKRQEFMTNKFHTGGRTSSSRSLTIWREWLEFYWMAYTII